MGLSMCRRERGMEVLYTMFAEDPALLHSVHADAKAVGAETWDENRAHDTFDCRFVNAFLTFRNGSARDQSFLQNGLPLRPCVTMACHAPSSPQRRLIPHRRPRLVPQYAARRCASKSHHHKAERPEGNTWQAYMTCLVSNGDKMSEPQREQRAGELGRHLPPSRHVMRTRDASIDRSGRAKGSGQALEFSQGDNHIPGHRQGGEPRSV